MYVLEDRVYIGGFSGVHQFVRIGEGAFIGALINGNKGCNSFWHGLW